MTDFAIRTRPVLLPIAGAGTSWWFAQAALQVNKPPYILSSLSFACFVAGIILLVLESSTLERKQIPKYLLQCIYVLNEPVLFMFVFLLVLDFLGYVQTLPFRDMVVLCIYCSLQRLVMGTLIVLGFHIGDSVSGNRPRQ